MKLTKENKELLKSWGHPETDFEQIEEATKKTIYKINYEEKISRDKAIELLGRRTYLSGISRSAFHFTACRQVEGTNDVVSFDSSKLFK